MSKTRVQRQPREKNGEARGDAGGKRKAAAGVDLEEGAHDAGDEDEPDADIEPGAKRRRRGSVRGGTGTRAEDDEEDRGAPHASAALGADAGSTIDARTRLRIVHIDVAQGESTLLVYSEGASVKYSLLVDGGRSQYAPRIAKTIGKYGVEKLDGIVVTHYDADHLGGVNALLADRGHDVVDKKTRLYIRGLLDYGLADNAYRNLIDASEDLERTVLAAGAELELGGIDADNLRITCLYADGGETHGDAENNSSVMLHVKRGAFSYYTGGDQGSANERDYLPACHVFKCGHHGSKHSSARDVVTRIGASVAIISAGKHSYCHPDHEVLDILEATAAIKGVYLTNCVYNRPQVNPDYLQCELGLLPKYMSAIRIKMEDPAPSASEVDVYTRVLAPLNAGPDANALANYIRYVYQLMGNPTRVAAGSPSVEKARTVEDTARKKPTVPIEDAIGALVPLVRGSGYTDAVKSAYQAILVFLEELGRGSTSALAVSLAAFIAERHSRLRQEAVPVATVDPVSASVPVSGASSGPTPGVARARTRKTHVAGTKDYLGNIEIDVSDVDFAVGYVSSGSTTGEVGWTSYPLAGTDDVEAVNGRAQIRVERDTWIGRFADFSEITGSSAEIVLVECAIEGCTEQGVAEEFEFCGKCTARACALHKESAIMHCGLQHCDLLRALTNSKKKKRRQAQSDATGSTGQPDAAVSTGRVGSRRVGQPRKRYSDPGSDGEG